MSFQGPMLIREPDLRWPIYLLAALITAALLIAGSLLYEMSRPSTYLRIEPRLEGALRPGSAEFAELSGRIVVEPPVAMEKLHPLNDMVVELTSTVRNNTGRTIRGLEMRGAVFEAQSAVLRERTVVVIPARQTALEPAEAINVRILLEGLNPEADRAGVLMEVTGLHVD
jgi:hypothetical protein